MKSKTLLLLFVAVGCGLAAAALVKSLIGRPADGGSARDRYLVAVTDMNAGDKITNVEQQFKIQDFLPGTAPPKAFTVEDVKARPDKVLGKVLVRPMTRGEPITERHLKDDNLTVRLPLGFRAVTIPVRLDAAVAGFTLPDTRVDLIGTYTRDGTPTTRMFLQDVLVLAVNVETSRQPTTVEATSSQAIPNPAVVTLAVKPRDAERIVWALRQSGAITLTLRRPDDGTRFKSDGIDRLDSTTRDEDRKDTVLRARRDIPKGEKITNPADYFEEVQDVPAALNEKNVFVPSLADEIFKKWVVTQTDLKAGETISRRSLGEIVIDLPLVRHPEPETHTLRIFNGAHEVEVKYARTDGGHFVAGSETPAAIPGTFGK